MTNWPREHPRTITYGAILAVAGLYLARALLHGGDALGWLMVAVAAIGILHLAGANLIREAVSYHPAYRVEKHIWGIVLLLGAVGVWWGVNWLLFAWCGAAATLAVELVAFEFILFKNLGMGDFLRTIFGLVPVPTPAEALLHSEYTAALWRHDLIPEVGKEAIREADGVYSRSEQVAHIRAWLARKREEAARNDALITDTEIASLVEGGP